jgi:TolA-binding protein
MGLLRPMNRQESVLRGEDPTLMSTTHTDQPVSGLPPDQVQAWLDSVQDQIRRVQTRIEYLQAEQARLQEQESLLMELHASAASPLG